MHLRFLAPLHFCFKTVLNVALLSVVLGQAAYAQQGKNISQAELQARLLEAKSSPELEQKLYVLGKKVAAVCVNCHGNQNGQAILEVPYLDGQNPAYLVEQIRQFSQGLRKNEFMEGILRAMNRDEMVGMVLFYEKEQPPSRAPKDAALHAKGKAYYERICFNCHGADGRGNERLPRIAGQHAGYVDLTLKRYRDGSSVRSDPNMAFVTKVMNDQDIRAVASYLESMP
ncbi:MAG TPA: c-type cytochrome [Comamonas sp.]|uniref:c-type cytochrome n=1 Tax=Comamonas halotolerans TaxID=3041496 RepID=UPI0024E18636|nr:c-type cytochrome [Comamonas sp. NoAH]